MPVKNDYPHQKITRHKTQHSRSSIGNFPIPLDTFIGREHEISRVKQLILAHRLVTLTGMGGSGKTRLALRVTQEIADKFKYSIWFVDLSFLTESSRIPDKIISALGIREKPGTSATDSVSAFLAPSHGLIILDNCEHLIKACTELVEHLLQKCLHLHILVTSRELLRIPFEVTWVVPPLTLPDPHTNSSREALKRAYTSESVQLFVERATVKDPDFKLTIDNYEAVIEICKRLDGMPLAIELAAAQVRNLSVQEIAHQLDQRFQLLTGGSRTAPQRQRTLIDTIDWSYALLTKQEQIVLQRLSIFSGGATLEAMGEVCSGGTVKSSEVLETISHLVDKSLATANRHERYPTRYHLLETIREYALAKLSESHRIHTVQKKHLNYFIQFTEIGNQKIRGAEEVIWYPRLEEEHDNLRAALQRALETRNIEAGLRLSQGLGLFWFTHGHTRESIDWLEKFLEQGRQRKDVLPSLMAWAFTVLGTMLRTNHPGDENESILLHEKSLKLFRKLKDRSGISWVLNQLGVIALQNGELDRAEKLLKESLVIRRETGDPWSIAQSLGNFTSLALQKNDLEKAKEYAEEELAWCQRTGNRRNTARALTDIADIARLEGDIPRAIPLLTQALSQVIPVGDKETIADLLISLAVLAVERSQYKRGALLLGSAESLCEEIGIPYRGLEYGGYAKTMRSIRKNLGDSKFQQTWRQGRNMSLETILEYAMQETGSQQTTTKTKIEEGIWLQLTLRERDMMRLLAQGRSNLEISQTLFLSEKTVRNHMSNIYRKLQTRNRGEIVLLAHKLVPHTEQ